MACWSWDMPSARLLSRGDNDNIMIRLPRGNGYPKRRTWESTLWGIYVSIRSFVRVCNNLTARAHTIHYFNNILLFIFYNRLRRQATKSFMDQYGSLHNHLPIINIKPSFPQVFQDCTRFDYILVHIDGRGEEVPLREIIIMTIGGSAGNIWMILIVWFRRNNTWHISLHISSPRKPKM